MSVEFGNPMWLWALAGLPVVAFSLAIGARGGRRELERFTGAPLLDALAPGYSWRRNLLKGLLQTLALALIILSLAQPRFGTQLVKVEREGIDIVLALDTSLSMLAEDMLPSRLERAKHEMVDLIRGLEGDRVGIVAFAGAAYPLCPLTVDYDAALMFLRSIDVYTVSEPGTAIDKAIQTSAALFDESRRRDRAVIIITDGENHEGSPARAAAEAGEAGIRIYTIGIGNPSGELIPERGDDGSIAGYKKDRRGETVLTRLDENTLQEVAEATGGKYLPATREGLELKVLYDEIAGMERRKIKGEFVERRKERFWIFLAGALAMLLFDALVSTRAPARVLRRRRVLHTGATLLVLAVVATAGTAQARSVKRSEVSKGNESYGAGEYGQAIERYRSALGDTLRLPENSQGVFYNEANALFMQERFGEAIARYQRAWSEDSTLTGQMLYNRGNAFIRAGQLQEAVESYVQALQYLPDDEQARHNLEMALRALEQQQEQEQQQQGDGEQEDEQQEQQDGESQNQDQQQQQEQQQEQEQQEQEQQDEREQQEQEQQPDSTQVEPPQPDSTQVPQPQLSPEDLAHLSREDAMRILQALEELEKQLQKERRRAAFRRLKKSGKDW